MKKKFIVIATLLTIVGASMYLYAQYPFPIKGISRNIGESTSPDGKYKLVDYAVGIKMYKWFYDDYDLVFSEVYDVKTGECLGTSSIYEIMYTVPTAWPYPDSPHVIPAQNTIIPIPMK